MFQSVMERWGKAEARRLMLELAVCAVLAALPGICLAKADYSFIGVKSESQVTQFLTQLQKAVAAGDRQAVAKMVSYPLMAVIDGQDVEIAAEADFVARYDQILTEDVRADILAQGLKAEDVFVNKDGVMVGDSGRIWALPDGKGLRISEIRGQ